MRTVLSLATILGIAAVISPLDAQNLADRVNAVRSNTVRLSFPTRPEICGDGKSIAERADEGFTTHTFWSGGYSINNNQEFWEFDCRTGENDRSPDVKVANVPVKVEGDDILIDVP